MSVLFVSGLLLGAVVHFADHRLNQTSAKATSSWSANLLGQARKVFTGHTGEERLESNTSTVAPASLPTVVQSHVEKERTIRKGLTFGKGLSLLLDAVKDPRSEDFKFIRSEFLQSVPGYSSNLLPPLKEASLNVMISRLTKSDWEAWPKASVLNYGAPTAAREYVESVMLQNRELGLFLETSALLLHGLYVTTNHGRAYDLNKGFDYLVGSADKLIPESAASTLPAKYLLSYSVPSDPSFLPTFERIRSSLVAQYVDAHPNELERNLRLLSTLDGRYQTRSSNEQLAKALLRLSKDGTPRFRKQIVEQLVASGQLDQVFLLSSRVKTSAAQLEAVAAVDALEIKDVLLAKKLLAHSLSLATGLPAQKLVGDFLREYGFGWVRPSLNPLERREAEAEGEENAQTQTAQSSKFTIFGVSMILLLLIGSLLGALFIKKKLSESQRLGSSTSYFEPSSYRSSPEFVSEPSSRITVGESKVAEVPRKVVNYDQFSN